MNIEALNYAGTTAEPVPVESASSAGPILSAEQLATFRRDGFLLVHGLASTDEVLAMRALYDRLFSERRGWDNGDMFDMVGRDDLNKGLALPQMLWPSRYEPALQQSKLAASARSVAAQLLGPKIENTLEHAIMKPAGHGAATPWHQDDAFSHKSSRFTEAISIWMPLQNVTIDSGAMRYIRGSNHGPLYPHRSPNNDPRIHGLEMVSDPELKNCEYVPMPMGAGVVHHSRTIHSAGVNTTDQPRRAYILGYAVKAGPRKALLTRDYPWNLEKQTARSHRELASMPPLKRTLRRFSRFLRGQKF